MPEPTTTTTTTISPVQVIVDMTNWDTRKIREFFKATHNVHVDARVDFSSWELQKIKTFHKFSQGMDESKNNGGNGKSEESPEDKG